MKRIALGHVIVQRDTAAGRVAQAIAVADQLYEWTRVGDPSQGIRDYAELETRLAVMGKLKASGQTDAAYVDLEDGEYETLKSAIAATRLLFADEGFLDCMKRVREAKSPAEAKTSSSR